MTFCGASSVCRICRSCTCSRSRSILDPEHREPFVSLGALFLAAGITPAEGLLRFELRRDRLDYDLSLAGLEPFDEIWVRTQC
jgi:hypothetical protein